MSIVEQHLENQRKHDIEPMETLIAQIRSAKGVGLELHPSYTQGLRRSDNLYVDYKLRETQSAVDRVLNLLICESEYAPNSGGHWSFHSDTAEEIRVEILNFWNGETTDRVRTHYIPAQQ